jgi:hypothetical protein
MAGVSRLKVMRKSLIMAAVAGMTCFATSCTTMYDSQGYPQQVVTPEGAAAGALLAGLVGYALNDSNDHHGHNRGYSRSRYGHRGGNSRGYRGGGYCR